MFVLFAVDIGASLLGVAALTSALGGIAATIMAIRKSHSEEYETCLESLKECRGESEKLAAELHKIKMAE